MRLFVDAIDEVERNYVAPVSRRELMEAAIEGVLSKLDNYSNYIAPDEMFEFQRDVEQEFGGLGIQINEAENGNIHIVSPLANTPAARAGLQPGDEITQIAGQPTADIGVTEAVRRMQGPIGSEVKLTISRQGQMIDVALKRQIVQIETVLGVRRLNGGKWNFLLDESQNIGYIRISSFGAHTVDDVQAAMRQLQAQQLRGLMLDLRNNPGGLLTAAIDISDTFLAQGRIVSAVGRNVPEKSWDASAEVAYTDFPMAVLVNEYSASGSEIVAACLQDNQRATIIGKRTWGKGSVQRLVMLQDGKSALKLTTATYLRPSGKNIHRAPDSVAADEWGVRPDPDMVVKLTPQQTRSMLLSQRDAFLLRGKQDSSPPPVPFFMDDQVSLALDHLRSQLP
jgi:carboxyl-terminal processing protease